MKKMRQDTRRVEDALIHFHRKRSIPEPGEYWKQGVMSRVLLEAAAGTMEQGNGLKFSLAAWRFAAVTFLLALVLAVYAMDAGTAGQYALAELILWETPGYDLARAFGVL